MFHAEPNAARVAELHPIVAENAHLWLAELERRGIEVLITESHRSPARQTALYAQGRSTAGPVVTNARAGESYHQYRLCFDFVPCDRQGNARWDGDFALPASFAKALGFEWGGDWTSLRDRPHLQYTFGLSIKDLLSGKTPPIPQTFKSNWW